MKMLKLSGILLAASVLSAASMAQNGRDVAVEPWVFTSGNETSKEMLISSISKIAQNHGLHVISQSAAQENLDSLRSKMTTRVGVPRLAELKRFAIAAHVGTLIFGTAGWHTRSIWVGTGPKTISTAKIDLYVYNLDTNKISYRRTGVTGRSDEKESTLKDIAAVLITPIIPMVSGGPATPREQRAAQIAVGRALRPWARQLVH